MPTIVKTIVNTRAAPEVGAAIIPLAEPTPGIEPRTSSLPWMRSTY